jgi:hypothetical protein
VPPHDPTYGRGRLRVWIFCVVALAAVRASAHAADAPGDASPGEPFVLAADRVQVWEQGGRHWVLLDGRAALMQGVEGIRAQRAVVRVERSRGEDGERERLEIYAEGNVRSASATDGGANRARFVRVTRPAARVQAHGTGKPEQLKTAPKGSPFLARAFPPEPSPNGPNANATVGQRDSRPLVATSIVQSKGVPEIGEKSPAPASNRNVNDSPQSPPSQNAVDAELLPDAALPAAPTVASPPVVAASAPDSQPPSATAPATEVAPALADSPAQTAPPVAGSPAPAAQAAAKPPVDPAVKKAQFGEDGFINTPIAPAPNDDPAIEDMPAGDNADGPIIPNDLQDPELAPPAEVVPGAPGVDDDNPAPILPSSRRFIYINPRDSGKNFTINSHKEGNTTTYIIRGGVTIQSEVPGRGMVDLSADSAVIWMQDNPEDANEKTLAGGTRVERDEAAPLEAYLEGNVVYLQDKRQFAGNVDQKRVEAPRFYYDFRREWFLTTDADLAFFTPGLIAPTRMVGKRIQQYRPFLGYDTKGKPLFGPTQIRANDTMTTGSRFPVPGYRFTTRALDLTQIADPQKDPLTGIPVGNPRSPNAPRENVWHIDARQNTYFIGFLPVFFWPKVEMDSDDLDPTIRNIQFHSNNYNGQQILTDWNMFKILGIRKPQWVDVWNLDIDYLSARGPATGSEIGWFGRDLIGDLMDPYRTSKNGRDADRPYFGYFDIWGLLDRASGDNLGPGPAIVTSGPPGAGRAGFQRNDVPYFVSPRERFVFRHMQSLLGPNATDDEDFRVQLEVGYNSDRYFLEEFYKRLFDTGMDEATLAYGIYQNQNRVASLLTEGNLQNWYTESQWLPKLDYYRLGDNFFGLFNYSQQTGVDYANTHTAIEVNNPRIFAFLPYDPISNTRGVFSTGRAYTNQEISMPLSFGFIRVIPYAQGQLVGWNNQINGQALGRAWGAVGGRANIMAWKNYPEIESELFNVHGLSHKINFDADFRSAYSNVNLSQIGVQDDLDANSYEYTRRYFALTNYFGGLLPPQYDPRLLTLRRAISPIGGTTDIQGTLETFQLGIRQRLQTKRGPEGRRRIIDWMTLDLTTTYFPNASRDNFGKPFGQNQYNWEWFIGDRTSILSYGWFEFFNIAGKPILLSNPRHSNNPLGLNVITSGISISRPPGGNIFFGYSVINTGPISTSALNVSTSYWLSPKWYGSFSTSYDFGNGILLGSTFAVTKIGADFLTSVGLTVDPQRQSYQFGFELSPRLSPSVRLGNGGGVARFDQRFAPTQ